jgi:cyclopropane fatty-acyl-phospholipid synthase-like methyltransferase
MGALDCNEYDNLKRRNFEPYSDGHQVMYEVPIALLANKRWTICEAGFGIGWGLGRMIEEGIVAQYVGFEPCADSFEYVRKIHHGNEQLTLHKRGFEYPGQKFDHVFCIETIEHVPMDGHAKFLSDLRKTTGRTLWFSTPDIRKHKTEGVRIWEEWKTMLHEAGFRDVTVHREQWTVLFVAQ